MHQNLKIYACYCLEMDLNERPFLVFADQDDRVKVVYRRDDGHYGLIEPE